MTTLFFEAAAALAAVAILLVGPLVLLRRRRKRERVAEAFARRLIVEIRREAVRGTLAERKKAPSKIAFVRRYCAEQGLALSRIGSSDRELDRYLARVDTKTPDDMMKTPARAFIPVRETVLLPPPSDEDEAAEPSADADDPVDRSGVRRSKAPASGPRMTRSARPHDGHAASEVSAALREIGDDGIDEFVETEFARITMRPCSGE